MLLLTIVVAISAAVKAATFQPLGIPFQAPVTSAPGFSAHVLFSNLTTPRGITFDSNQNLLVVERGFGVTAFSPVISPATGWERTVVLQNALLTQGIQVDGTKLYVSSASDALVYNYDPITKSIPAGASPTTVVTGLPPDGDLTTHTLQLEKNSAGTTVALLIASGPKTNIDVTARDPASGRSQIRRFVFPSAAIPTVPLSWTSGEILAYGIRNPAGFAFPLFPAIGVSGLKPLYVVENGASIDNATGLTPTFVNDNPADELEFVVYPTNPSSAAPKSYGFPDCTTLWNPTADPVGDPQFVGKKRGDQFSLNLDPTRDDAWCQNKANNLPPVLSFQAHSVPLDIKFYAPPPHFNSKSFPLTQLGDAFVSFHGSFNRNPPTGYGVVRVPFPLGSQPTGSDLGYSFIVQATTLTSCPGRCIRPVGLAFGEDGKLYVSSDSSGELFVIEKE